MNKKVSIIQVVILGLMTTVIIAMAFWINFALLAMDNLDDALENEHINYIIVRDRAEVDKHKLEVQLLEVERTMSEMTTKVELLKAFKDAGHTSLLTIEDVQSTLDVIKHVPYGSPFAEGHYITSHTGYRDETPINGDGYTDGVDLAGLHGDSTVRSTADGTIVDFGYSETFGKYIVIEHEGGFRTKYSHLKTIYYQNEKHEVLNCKVIKGDRIGVMGNTGLTFSTIGGDGTHLDYRIFIYSDEQWKPLNPEVILKYAGRA